MPRMTRRTSRAIAALTTCAVSAPALAVFTGIDLREDKGQIPPVELAQIDPAGLGVRVINLYSVFDGPGDYQANPTDPDATLAAFSNDEGATLEPWRIRKTNGAHASAGYYQDPFAGNTAPLQAIVDIFPSVQWDSYVDLAMKVVAPGETDTTFTDPSFAWVDQDSDGRHDGIIGGWHPVAGAGQHVATFNPASMQYEVFLAQLTVVGLDAGASLGYLETPVAGEGDYNWRSDIFDGQLTIATQKPGGGALFFDFNFVEIPAPSSALCALPIGALAARRRRGA